MTTNIDQFNIDPCEKIDADCINAYVDFHLDPDSDTGICLDTSWGGACLDLTDIVKTAETCTKLYLSPADGDPNCLVYEGECDNYCIHGDDLSRIISLTKLKDVEQTKPIMDGGVYMYNSSTGKFEPYDLKSVIGRIDNSITNLNAAINQILNRLSIIEEKLTPPEGAPSNVRVAFGNINLYSDNTYTGSGNFGKGSGLYTHSLNVDVTNDEVFA